MNLDYFNRMRMRQLERRQLKKLTDKSCTQWMESFLAPETWRNLRLSIRGFFGYYRYLIHMASITPDNSRPKSVPWDIKISPAHSNTSNTEAWFSVVRKGGQDDAVAYPSGVANKNMTQATSALKNNKMYHPNDVGEISAGKFIGPHDLTNFYKHRTKLKDDQIREYKAAKSLTNSSISAFSQLAESSIPPELSALESEVLKIIIETSRIPNGYASFLVSNDSF